MSSSCIFLTSLAKTASAATVESMHDALIEMTTPPPFLRKYWALWPTIRAWSGCERKREGWSRSFLDHADILLLR